MGTAFGDLLYGLDNVALAIDGCDSAELFGQSQFRRVEVHPDHICYCRTGDHHCGEADAAAAMHGDPLARSDFSLVDHGAKRRGEPTSQTRSGGKIHRLGQRDHVQIGLMDRHIFRKAALMGEAGLFLMQAYLLVTRMAFAARAAATDERHGDPIARRPVLDVPANCLDHTGQFVAGMCGSSMSLS